MSSSVNNGEIFDELLLEEEARSLRLALDIQLENLRTLTVNEQIGYTVDEAMSALIMLVSQYSELALQKALLMTIGSPEDDFYTGRYPLHLACDTNAPVQVIQFFLQHEPQRKAVRHKDKWEDLPIHTACSRKNYTEVVELLLEYDDASKGTLFTKRYDGSLPIHTACRYNAPPKVIQLLLDNDTTTDRETLFTKSLYDQIPLHVACRCNLNPESMQLLLDYDRKKQSVCLEDSAGRIPLHIAYLYCPKGLQTETFPKTKTSVELLLYAILHGRIERVGLVNWKHCMHSLLKQLSIPERDFNASDQLELTCQTLRSVLERAILLELGVWKASCSLACQWGEMQTISVKDLSSDSKRNHRIKSGAEAIIPRVLAFLEDEPINHLLDQMGYK